LLPTLCHENNRDMGATLASARADEEKSLRNAAEPARDRQPMFEELKAQTEEWSKKR
jgi:hypothetical protein